MITSTLLNIANLMVSWFISIRPVWQPVLPTSVSTVIGYSKAYDTLLPVTETLACLGLALTALTAFLTLKWGVKLVDWVADIIP